MPGGFRGTLLNATIAASFLDHFEQRPQNIGDAFAADGGDDERRFFCRTLKPGHLLFDLIRT